MNDKRKLHEQQFYDTDDPEYTDMEPMSDEEFARLYPLEAELERSESLPPVERAPIDYKVSPFLTTKQAAHYLSLSFRTLEKMRETARGPCFRRHEKTRAFFRDCFWTYLRRLSWLRQA